MQNFAKARASCALRHDNSCCEFLQRGHPERSEGSPYSNFFEIYLHRNLNKYIIKFPIPLGYKTDTEGKYVRKKTLKIKASEKKLFKNTCYPCTACTCRRGGSLLFKTRPLQRGKNRRIGLDHTWTFHNANGSLPGQNGSKTRAA